jgi:uncharacterized protein (DUF1697 family)
MRPGEESSLCLNDAVTGAPRFGGSFGKQEDAPVALVVFLRGVNVGGHRTFRPTTLASQLRHLGAVNVGAAGTFVIRQPVTRGRLRSELARRLPFDTDIMICRGREIGGLVAQSPFENERHRPGIVRFVTVLSRIPRSPPPTPLCLPSTGRWMVKVLARDGCFVLGLYRRQMKVIRYLGAMDQLFGVSGTTRNWNTITAIAAVLEDGRVRSA